MEYAGKLVMSSPIKQLRIMQQSACLLRPGMRATESLAGSEHDHVACVITSLSYEPCSLVAIKHEN